jgi:aminoglycoside phosphotransferase
MTDETLDSRFGSTRPNAEQEKHRFHWLTSERVSYPTVSHWSRTEERWYGFDEVGSITPEELARRGWTYYKPIPLPDDVEDWCPGFYDH